MNLKNKKKLIARVLGVGVDRVLLDSEAAAEIKEAITRQDIRDLKKDNLIKIKEKKGRRKNIKRKTKKRGGSIKKRVNKRKQDYVKLTRKLRNYIKKSKNKLTKEKISELRKKIKSGIFKDISHLKEAVKETEK